MPDRLTFLTLLVLAVLALSGVLSAPLALLVALGWIAYLIHTERPWRPTR